MAAAIQAVKDGQSRLRPHVKGIEDLRRDLWDEIQRLEIPSKITWPWLNTPRASGQ